MSNACGLCLPLWVLAAFAAPLAGQTEVSFPWDPQYKIFDCAGTPVLTVGSAERGPSAVVLSAEPDAKLSGRIRIAAATATPLMSGEPAGEGFEDVSAGLKQLSTCEIALPPEAIAGSGRVAIHMQVDPGRPVILVMNGRRSVIAPGTTTYNGRAINFDPRLSALRVAALTYSSQFPPSAALEEREKGRYSITPAGLRAHLEANAALLGSDRLSERTDWAGWRMVPLRLHISEEGVTAALNSDPSIAAIATSLKFKAFEMNGRRIEVEGDLPLLVDAAGRVYCFF
jgi:hypothetical protein